ncbi:Esterase PHB depolymerase (plasmid) [Caballeronia sp. SBC1]|uniref:extracellular catalytic domain type 1 short-chain-length polyhydroxyalkanoate depolymerase n=1 Tax=unclassified Caballeronia TaxID=2646786 RepID=UPI0013E1972D|nr:MULTISPECIES: PHB depolymerase family esterase [unclassified Caballeronia]QIE28728.1 Esterase PHB depolymerase [Caballeronia sp. SBC2]QIN66783.1 Esterase PHB depolymerase [Caballeronia sp. SBC1]
MKISEGFLHSMQDAMKLLRARGPREATAALQRALGAHAQPATQTNTDAPAVPYPGTFTTHTFTSTAGHRSYKLYVPKHHGGRPLPLVVMLHGCTQDADDFAAGTQMNAQAERDGCIVVYPVQPQGANASKCWNWFKPTDQRRDSGEPALIAGITREVMSKHAVDPARVFVAGLSAGGAMAAIMVQAYPDLYAAACVHSGLAVGSAHDLQSALAAMRGGKSPGASRAAAPKRPLIVFHGDADATVHPSNAAELLRGFGAQAVVFDETSHGEGGKRKSTVERLKSAEGVDAELWRIHGAPHAWAGGSANGSYTDATGPCASAVMMRFFRDHPLKS